MGAIAAVHPAHDKLGQSLGGAPSLKVADLMCRTDWAAIAAIVQAVFAGFLVWLQWKVNKLQETTAALQKQLFEFQKTAEEVRNACHLYVRVRQKSLSLGLTISNLSEYDIWIRAARIYVKRDGVFVLAEQPVGGATHLPRGLSEDDFNIEDAIRRENDYELPIDMEFYVEVIADAKTKPVTRQSPIYRAQYHMGVSPVLTTLETSPPLGK